MGQICPPWCVKPPIVAAFAGSLGPTLAIAGAPTASFHRDKILKYLDGRFSASSRTGRS